MQMIYSARDSLLVSHIKNLLQARGIDCTLRNEFLAGAMGELPPTETWPELWVAERDVPRAQAVIDNFHTRREQVLPAWRCPRCGEDVDGEFDLCWNCGESRPDPT